MEVDIEWLKEIANNYDVTFATVMRIYQRLKEISCVELGQYMTTKHSVSDAIFHIYGDETIPYIDDKYL